MLPARELARLRADLERTLPETAVLYSLSQASDGQGGLIDTWTAAGTVSARLDNSSGSKTNVAQSVNPFSSWVLTVPQDTDLTTAHRVTTGGETYVVIAVSDLGSWLGVKRAHLERV
jgi:head-tail adaptor